jgi:hypothetical protein
MAKIHVHPDKEAIVDKPYARALRELKWRCGDRYVIANFFFDKTRSTISMHRMVLLLKYHRQYGKRKALRMLSHVKVSHKNGDIFDNRLRNLNISSAKGFRLEEKAVTHTGHIFIASIFKLKQTDSFHAIVSVPTIMRLVPSKELDYVSGEILVHFAGILDCSVGDLAITKNGALLGFRREKDFRYFIVFDPHGSCKIVGDIWRFDARDFCAINADLDIS